MKERRYEYGGYLGLELPKCQEYFDFLPSSDVLRVNCGRTASYCAVKDAKIHKVYCPHLNCSNSTDPMKMANVEIEYYFLNEDLTPKNVHPKEDEAVLWVNYYGNASETVKKKICHQFPLLIVDNCNAFFSSPLPDAYNCYSTRKFFGVADGGYLIHSGIGMSKLNLPESFSAEDSGFLMKTIERGTNAVYSENLINESRLENNIAKMSPLTKRILSSIDYINIQKMRQRNILKLHENLKDVNCFPVNIKTKTQMYYPLLVEQDSLRERLIQNRIYTPTWWRHVPKQSGYADIETRLSKYMVFLPIDQRYDEDDMDRLSEIVYSLLDKGGRHRVAR